MKIKNVKVGELTLKDILEDIKSRCTWESHYQSDRDAMISRISYYLEAIK